MVRIVVEDDAILRIVPVILDPAASADDRRAVADLFAQGEPDFYGWCDRLRARIPGLYQAEVAVAVDQSDLRAKLPGADAVIAESLKIGDAELAAAPRLAVVQKFGVVTANIDAAACARHAVPVDTLRRRVNIATAERAIAVMLARAKRIAELNGLVEEAALRKAGFDPTPYDRRYTGNSNFARIRGLRTLYGATLGLIGMGEIGREMARMAAGFEMKPRYYDGSRIPEPDETALGVTHATLAELLEQSDYLSIQLPMAAAPRGMVGAAELQRVKPDAIVVDAERAELVDRAALLAAFEAPARPGGALSMLRMAVAARQHALADMEELCLKLWRHVSVRRG